MKILLLDTSTSFLFVSFFDDTTKIVLYEKSMLSHNNHSENLIGVIEEGLKMNHMALKDFGKIIIGQGPGSYTGLRVGMVVGKMASFCLNIPLYTISSLQFIGSKYLTTDGIYQIKSIAKKEHCYGTIIKVAGGAVYILVKDSFMTEDEFTKVSEGVNSLMIDEKNYAIDCIKINELAQVVEDVHQLVPNYLRKANT